MGRDHQRVARSKPLVSVVIPTYNRARLLQEALASVYGQEGVGERFELEVIVVDDASGDGTPEVMRQHAAVRYIRLERNGGPARAMNVGIRASRGEYVAFLDDDNLWLPYKFVLQLPVLEAHPEAGVVYGQHIVRHGEEVVEATEPWPDANAAPSGWVFRAMLMDWFVSPLTAVVRREAFEKAGYLDESDSIGSVLDYDMFLRIAFYFPFIFKRGAVGIYRPSPQGMAVRATVEGRTGREIRNTVEKALRMLPDRDPDYLRMSREARARAGLRTADLLGLQGEREQMRAQIMRSLAEFPWMADEDWARSWIARTVAPLALASEWPLAAVRALCTEISAAGNGGSLGARVRMRRLLADVWAEVALGLRWTGSRWLDRQAAYAAACALLHDPGKIRQAALFKVMARAVLSSRKRRTDAVVEHTVDRVGRSDGSRGITGAGIDDPSSPRPRR